MTVEGELLWEPTADSIARARITGFGRWLGEHGGVTPGTYDEMWQWSVADLDAFWSALAEWYGVRWHSRPTAGLADATMPGARWFPGATLNYAEHSLFPPCGVADDDVAVVFVR